MHRDTYKAYEEASCNMSTRKEMWIYLNQDKWLQANTVKTKQLDI